MGVVGSYRQDRAGRQMSHVALQQQIPGAGHATASILNPSLVACAPFSCHRRTPAARSARGAVIPIECNGAPVEGISCAIHHGILRASLASTLSGSRRPFGDLIESAADNLAGKGRQLNETLNQLLSQALTALNEAGETSPDHAEAWRYLSQSALYQNDHQFVALNLAEFHRLVHQISTMTWPTRTDRRGRSRHRPKVRERQQIRAGLPMSTTRRRTTTLVQIPSQ